MTTAEPFDWSKLPSSKYGDDVWLAIFLPDKIDRLRRLHEAIGKWRLIADEELEEYGKQCELERTPAWDEYQYEPLHDEAFMMLETERAMFANLGVSIASAAENFIFYICKVRGASYIKADKNDFSTALASLSEDIGATISDLPGYLGNQRARMLGNCFKHSEGRKDQRFVKKFGGEHGESIEYEKENWAEMIADTETLLSQIISRFKVEPNS